MRLILISILFFNFSLMADPLKPLPIDFLDDKKTKVNKKSNPKKKSDKNSLVEPKGLLLGGN